eukprot:TRINITY_DN27670_c0_g1_i1.p1 TRINITY_DN27670_c0_g1~~TRINITY_DN27670_c0_g1_i1.p1  ORF type:complete len:288 (+),score=98.21 TRINITY_DN27670_c0_g1_i1:83-865(+)
MADSPDGVFSLSPTELYFAPPLVHGAEIAVSITNRTQSAIVFKFRTTTPERYSVKPRMGIIGPQETRSASVAYSVRDSHKVGWKPEDPAAINDRFQVVVRRLSGPAEEAAWRAWAASPPDVAAARTALGLASPAQSGEGDIAAALWQRAGPQCQRELRCVFARRGSEAAAAPAAAAPDPASWRTPQKAASPGAGAAGGDLAALTSERDTLQRRLEHLRAEDGREGPAVSWFELLLAAVLVGAAFYLGLVFDRLLPPEEEL